MKKKLILLTILMVSVSIFSACEKFDQNNIKSIVSSEGISNLNDKTEETQININELKKDYELRIMFLEEYLYEDNNTPEAVAKLWIEAYRIRNGAVRYALYSNELREKEHEQFVGMSWSLGLSDSPKIKEYNIEEPILQENGQTLVPLNVSFSNKPLPEYPPDFEAKINLFMTNEEDGNKYWRINLIQEIKK